MPRQGSTRVGTTVVTHRARGSTFMDSVNTLGSTLTGEDERRLLRHSKGQGDGGIRVARHAFLESKLGRSEKRSRRHLGTEANLDVEWDAGMPQGPMMRAEVDTILKNWNPVANVFERIAIVSHHADGKRPGAAKAASKQAGRQEAKASDRVVLA